MLRSGQPLLEGSTSDSPQDRAGELDRLRAALAGRYAVEREIGHGGMARVYLAQDLPHARRVAVKLLAPEIATLLGPERFLREIRIEASLQHPHILPLYDSGSADGLLYYVMPYVEGQSLRDRLQHERQLPIDDALRITRQVADALDHAHGQGIVHRDIKPGNILLAGYDTAGGPRTTCHALVADFGIARAVESAGEEPLTATGIAVGTPEYMSPEQGTGERSVDRRTDIYALGCVLYEMLAGSPPFSGRTVQWVVARHRLDPVPSLRTVRESVSPQVEAAVMRALAKVPADRFATAGEFADALEKPSVTPASTPSGADLPRAGAAWRRRARLVLAAGLVVVAGVALALGLRVRRGAPATAARPSWVLVADLDGPPGDRGLATAVRELVTAALEQSSAVVPMPRQQLEAVMQSAGLADTVPIKGSLARELAVRASVRAILGGSVLPVGRDRYSVVLRVVDPDSGATIATATRTAEERDLVPAVQGAAREIRQSLGERRGILGIGLPMSHVATPSFAAFRKFVEGVELGDRGDLAASNGALREALELDTAFALAWVAMVTNYISMHNLDSAGVAVREALRYPQRLSDAQRYRLQADAAYTLRGDIPAAVGWFDRLLQVSPNSISGTNNRATYVYSLGRYDEALAGFARAEALEPFGPEQAQIEIFNQAVTLLALGRDADAGAMARRLSGPFADYATALLATYQGRWAAADSVASRLVEDPSTPSYFRLPSLTTVAGAVAARGNPIVADQRLRTAAERDPSNRPWFTNAALLLAEAGGRDPGAVPAWLAADTSIGGLASAGLWAAMARDTGLARRRLAALQRRPEPDRRRLGHSLTLLEAYLLRAEGRWDEVAERLGPAALAGELNGGDVAQVSSAALRWLMAEAYENLGKRDSAIVMYERILDPRRTPFTHLTLRGLVHRFALERLDAVRRHETMRPDDADPASAAAAAQRIGLGEAGLIAALPGLAAPPRFRLRS